MSYWMGVGAGRARCRHASHRMFLKSLIFSRVGSSFPSVSVRSSSMYSPHGCLLCSYVFFVEWQDLGKVLEWVALVGHC